MRTGNIYKITCLINNKVYIGQTILDNPMLRWKQHYEEYKKGTSDLFIYRAMNKHGIENFSFQILETGIALKDINQKEEYYISLYNSNNSTFGYNLTAGGQTTHNSKYSEEEVRTIIQAIKNNPNKTLTELGKELGVTSSTMSDINCGDTWCFSDETYPIRYNEHYKLNDIVVLEIIDRLRSGESSASIARDYNVSTTNIANINKGLIYRQPNIEYPIYKASNSRKRLTVEEVQTIINLLLTTDLNYNEISSKLGIGRKTISNINNGLGYREIVMSLGYETFPLR